MSAARDISTIVLLGSSQSRTLALLALDFAYGGQFERGTVVAVLTVAVVVVAAFIWASQRRGVAETAHGEPVEPSPFGKLRVSACLFPRHALRCEP
jgi:hypothetical protein